MTFIFVLRYNVASSHFLLVSTVFPPSSSSSSKSSSSMRMHILFWPLYLCTLVISSVPDGGSCRRHRPRNPRPRRAAGRSKEQHKIERKEKKTQNGILVCSHSFLRSARLHISSLSFIAESYASRLYAYWTNAPPLVHELMNEISVLCRRVMRHT